MTEITREILELAALAAGYEVACTEAEMQGCEDSSAVYMGLMLRGVQDPWRPHLDDGDAARLADNLLMYVDARGTAVQARVVGGEWHRVDRADDSRSAWRDAIILCAAEVGRRMREGAK